MVSWEVITTVQRGNDECLTKQWDADRENRFISRETLEELIEFMANKAISVFNFWQMAGLVKLH